MAAKDSYAENEKLLWKMIKSRNIGSLYLFYGPEIYLKRNYAEQIEKAILTEDFKLLNKVTLEGKVTPTAIIDNCETLPAFSDRRLVIVKNSGLFRGTRKGSGADAAEITEDAAVNDIPGDTGEGSAEDNFGAGGMNGAEAGDTGGAGKKADGRRKRAAGGDELADFLQNVPKHVCLVFMEEEIDKRIKYVKLIEQYGLIVEFNFRKPDELTGWVMKRINELGHETNPHAAALIVEYCEPGMDDILNEIKKLCAFAGSRRTITEDDVERVCTRSVKSRVFDLTDAIAANQVAKALSLLNDMEMMREPMPKVMYMIARQFRQLIQVKLMLREGAPQSAIASHFRVQPFIAKKLINQAQKFTEEKLEKAVSTGLELDLSVKTGRLDSKAAVELMIASLSG